MEIYDYGNIGGGWDVQKAKQNSVDYIEVYSNKSANLIQLSKKISHRLEAEDPTKPSLHGYTHKARYKSKSSLRFGPTGLNLSLNPI